MLNILIADNNVDIVLLDFKMPFLSGIEIITNLTSKQIKKYNNSFIEYLKLSHMDLEAPDSVTIKSKKDLKEKLQKGLNAIQENKVYSLNDVFTKLENI